ncbi:MAG: hypothetical protein V3T70_02730 [Phycisphaerae bacterium]
MLEMTNTMLGSRVLRELLRRLRPVRVGFDEKAQPVTSKPTALHNGTTAAESAAVQRPIYVRCYDAED